MSKTTLKRYNLHDALHTIPGVGSKTCEMIQKLLSLDNEPRLIDMLFLRPVKYIDRGDIKFISESIADEYVSLKVKIASHQNTKKYHRKTPYIVKARDDTGEISLLFFSQYTDYITKQLPIGEERIVSGKMQVYKNQRQITHPDFIIDINEEEKLPKIQPIYPLTEGLSQKKIWNIIKNILDKEHYVEEWINEQVKVKFHFQDFISSLKEIHFPIKVPDITNNIYAQRLGYDEIFSEQLALAYSRQNKSFDQNFISHEIKKNFYLSAIKSIPFQLTQNQKEILDQISNDLKKPAPMQRIVQGDVGSGKTIVGFLSMVMIAERLQQSAFMAPTTILAEQHYKSFISLNLPIKAVLLTGSVKGKKRQDIIENINLGFFDVVFGTHALFQEDINFKNLGLVIIDEQHRFGVKQRLSLLDKGINTHLLSMTATPIPRTLVLSYYGDMDISILSEKPAGRKSIDTRIISIDRLEHVVAALQNIFDKDERVYWICPLVEENDIFDVTSVEERFAFLDKKFHNQVAFLHGKMKSDEKEKILRLFTEGHIKLLVSTTVVEVGVNVPDATVMVIEHAERFGLAQLHQLRGRVGRNDKQSSCVLLYGDKISATATERLKIMKDTNDGFLIAEKDLQLRGHGALLGIEQSGLPSTKFLDWAAHAHLIKFAKDDAKLLLTNDPHLETRRGKSARLALSYFNRDNSQQWFRSG